MSWPFSFILSLRSTPLGVFPTSNPSALVAGSSPRKPGSLLMEVANMLLRSSALQHNARPEMLLRLRQAARLRKPGSLQVNLFFDNRLRFNLHQHLWRNQL